jgi:hypothetical protein
MPAVLRLQQKFYKKFIKVFLRVNPIPFMSVLLKGPRSAIEYQEIKSATLSMDYLFCGVRQFKIGCAG